MLLSSVLWVVKCSFVPYAATIATVAWNS